MPPKRNINIKNPYNPLSNLYKKLTKLWAGPLITTTSPKSFELGKRNVDKYKEKMRTPSGQEFQRNDIRHPAYYLYMDTYINAMRNERYLEFDQMELHPDCASVLETYADEITCYTELNPPIKIVSNNLDIKECLNKFFYDTLNMPKNLYSLVYSLLKQGDLFVYCQIDDILGITNIIPIPAGEVERLEGQDESNPNYVQFQWNRAGQTYEYGWNMVHFRLLGSDKYHPYGMSIYDAARRAYHQLCLLENAVIGYRVVRSPERRVFYVDVGGINDEEIPLFIEEIKKNLKQSVITNPSSGQAEKRWNPVSVEEDYVVGVRGQNSGTKIDTLPGGSYTGDIEDLKHARDKLFTSLGVPAAYFSQDSNEDRQSLAQKDIKFGKRILRIQNHVVAGLTELAITHLYILGFRDEDLVNFEIKLNNPSRIAEMQELEQMRSRLDLANSAGDFFCRETIYKKFLGLSDDEIKKEMAKKYADAKYDLSLQQFEDSGDGGAALGGDLGGGGLDSPIEGLSDVPEDENPFSQPPESSEGGDDDSVLLSEPSESDLGNLSGKSQKRLDDDEYLTPGAKGKPYSRAVVDKRFAGARRRSNSAQSPVSFSKSTKKNLFGSGFESLRSLSKGIVTEELLDEEVELSTEELYSVNQSLINENDERDEKNET